MKIGRKYEETRRDLVERIKNNEADTRIVSSQEGRKGYSTVCYFCFEKIKGDVYRVELREENKTCGYHLDSKCYFEAWGVLE